MFCGGTLVVDVRVICYSRVREQTSHSGPSSIHVFSLSCFSHFFTHFN